jgi:hypothetical protein
MEDQNALYSAPSQAPLRGPALRGAPQTPDPGLMEERQTHRHV